MRLRLVIMSLGVVALATFFPCLVAEPNLLDDVSLIKRISESPGVPWRDLFVPGGGAYYRPVLMLTFFVDKLLWNLNSGVMHLINILIHYLNGFLVYILISKISSAKAARNAYMSLCGAFIFLVHPVNVESVAWISGRSDILATTFALLSALLLIEYIESKKSIFIILNCLSIVVGTLVKEIVVVMVLFNIFVINNADMFKKKTIYFLTLTLLPMILFLLRIKAMGGNDKSFLGLAKIEDLAESIFNIAKAYGFYLKKIFMPYPLNFAITDVSSTYFYFGVVFFIVCIWLVMKNGLPCLFVGASFFMLFLPGVLSAVDIAWTPYAERYLYLPLAFFVIGCFTGADSVFVEKSRRVITGVFLVAFLCSGMMTYARCLVWQKNVALYEDTVSKSPGFLDARILLGLSMEIDGRLEDALESFRAGVKIAPDNPIGYRNLARVLYRLGRNDEATRILVAASEKYPLFKKEFREKFDDYDEFLALKDGDWTD